MSGRADVHLQIRLAFQLRPTEPANYRGSYTAVSKGIVDIEIAMYQIAETIVTTAMKLLLLKLTIPKEKGGGLRN